MIRSILIIVILFISPTLLLAQQPDSARNKIAPFLRVGKSYSAIRIMVKDKAKFKAWLNANLPGIDSKEQSSNVYQIKGVTAADIKKLEKAPSVIFIDRAHRTPIVERSLGEFDFTLNKIPAVHNQYQTLTGAGLVVSIKEDPFDLQDIDLRNRIVLNDQFNKPYTQHASVMATISVGAGNSEPSSRGVAPAANVTTSDFNLQLSPDDGNELQSLGVSVQNHSYGVREEPGNYFGIENYYGIESNEYDKHCQDFPTLIHVFSSGNRGDKADSIGAYAGLAGFANLTGQFKVSKNTISVGAANRFGNVVALSSRGPAHDGRVKPELLAYGEAGTSDAAAVVSGITLLIQQYYKDLHDSLPPSSLVKAVLVNSADDSGRPEVDFETGYGNADAIGAVRAIEQSNFFLGNVSQDDDLIHLINIPAGVFKLKASLVWNDPAALPDTAVAIVNDLDFELVHVGSGDRWKPWVLNHYPLQDSLVLNAKRKEDHLNTIEQITVQSPLSGDYELHIKGFNVPQGPQAYSIVFEYESGFEWTNPVAGNSFVANKNTIVRWRWSEEQLTGKLEFKYADESTWIEISDGIELSQQYFQWTTPDTTALAQLRLTANSQIFESDIFSISKPINLKVGYNCEEEAMLIWNKVTNAQQYQLYRLGDTYLEPHAITTDTFTILNAIEKEFLFYVVAPIFQGVEGVRDATRNYTLQGTGCYVISFLPQQYVITDNAVFDLKIGTTYGVDSATLERLHNSVFEEVQKIKPIADENMVFLDADPTPGTNTYRVRLNRSNGLVAYSNSEQIVYVRNRDIFMFPNPVLSGELLNIIVADDQTVGIKVYDFLGRIVEETDDSGNVKSFDTSSLIKGTYIVEVTKSNGVRQTARLIVW